MPATVVEEAPIFVRIRNAQVVLSRAGMLTVHDVYTMPTDKARKEWGVYGKVGSGFVRLHANRLTSKSGVKVHSFHLPFEVQGTTLGYLSIPSSWRET